MRAITPPFRLAVGTGLLTVLVLVGGCKLGLLPERPVPLPPGVDAGDVRDVAAVADPDLPRVSEVLRTHSEAGKDRREKERKDEAKKYNEFHSRRAEAKRTVTDEGVHPPAAVLGGLGTVADLHGSEPKAPDPAPANTKCCRCPGAGCTGRSRPG